MIKKILILITLILGWATVTEAQLKRTWKRQIYGGYNRIAETKNHPGFAIVDLNYVTKSDWLFNAGCTFASEPYSTSASLGSGLFSGSATVSVRQWNLSGGCRVDLSPKWMLALFGGPSFTSFKYPSSIRTLTIKNEWASFTSVGAQYTAHRALGLHLQGEIGFLLCDNMMLQVGYLYDFNGAYATHGFTFGGRLGLMKQKFGSRRISSIRI